MAEEWSIAALAVLVVATLVGRWWWALARAERPTAPGSTARIRLHELESELLGAPPPEERARSQAGGDPRQTGSRESSVVGSGPAASLPATPPVLDGVLPAATFAWEWAQLDDSFFRAVGHMTGKSIESLADANAAIAHWDIDAIFGPAAGLVSKFKGHLGEQIAAAELLEAGANVEFPELSNQAGWDLLVDGEPFNVKIVANFSSLQEHFSQYADIPVLIPGDTAGIPEELLRLVDGEAFEAMGEHGIVVLEELSNAAITETATDALELTAGQVGASFPVFTAAFAIFREGRLLHRGHTNLKRAGANVLADTGSIGLGSSVGAKVGAALGTLIAPGVGTAVGAVLGGSGGALLGRTASRKVKEIPLKKAQLGFEQAVSDHVEARDRELLGMGAAWKDSEDEERKRLRSTADAAKRDADSRIEGARAALRAAHSLPHQAREAVLESAERDLADAARASLAVWRSHALWRRWLWPNPELITSRRRARSQARYLECWRRDAAPLRSAEGDETESFLLLVVETQSGEAAARALLQGIAAARVRAVRVCESAVAATAAQVSKARMAAEQRLREKGTELADRLEASLRPSLEALNAAREALEDELRKAGKAAEALPNP